MQASGIRLKCTGPALKAAPLHKFSPSAAPPRIVRVPSAGSDEAGNPLFNAQFMGVLQQSLARQGADALTKGASVTEEERTSAVEEVLGTALMQSKHTLKMLQQWRHQIDSQIAAQEKQVGRMEFALNKARNDAAYMKALKDMVYDSGPE